MLLTHAADLLCLQLHTVQSPHTVHASNTCCWLAVPTAAAAVSQFLCTCVVSIWLSLVWQLYRYNWRLARTGCAASGAETLPLTFCQQWLSDDTTSGGQHLQTASPAIQSTHLHHPASPKSHFPQTQPWNTFRSSWHKCSQLQPVPTTLVITNITACMTDWSPHAVNVRVSQQGKVTAVLIHIVKACRGSWGIPPIILYLGASGRWVIRRTLRPL